MDKAKINNEIVLLRKNVHQARIHVIKRLTREALKLRRKKGTDAQKAKNCRKAKRLAAEVLSIKKVKKDEITRFILSNTLTLEEILQDTNSESSTKIMARIGEHKTFKAKILEFKSKYPDYMKFMEPGRKKLSKLQPKEKALIEAIKKVYNKADTDKLKSSKENHTVDSNKSENESGNDSDTNINEQSENEGETEIELENENYDEKPNKKKNLIKAKRKKSLFENQENIIDNNKAVKNLEQDVISKKKKIDYVKPISKEAIVKKFNEIIQDDECSLDNDEQFNSAKSNIEVKKQVDSFFVMEDGETDYLSLVPEKSKLTDDIDNDYNDNTNEYNNSKFSRRRNDDFAGDKFNKFPKSNNKFKPKPEYPRNKGNSFEDKRGGRRVDFKKSNSDFKNKPTPFKRNFKNNHESESSETLHPSWEAKKKQQELIKQGFQGKKIVFDDNL